MMFAQTFASQRTVGSTPAPQQSATSLQVWPAMRHMPGGGGAQTLAPPPTGGRQSPPQHSLPTLHVSPLSRQARGAQYAETAR